MLQRALERHFCALLGTLGVGFPGKHLLPAPQHEGKANKSLQTTKSVAGYLPSEVEQRGSISPAKGTDSLPQDAKPFPAWEKWEFCKGITPEVGVRLPSILTPHSCFSGLTARGKFINK